MKNGKAQTVLITGGARSGKSDFAIELADKFSSKTLVATAVATDSEMAERIEKHRKSRGKEWSTVEEPTELGEKIKALYTDSDVVVIDCITFWINNLLIRGDGNESISHCIDELALIVSSASNNLIIVTNEVGSGIVPANELTRNFRDLTGLANRKLAEACKRVVLMVAGIPMKIKDTEKE